MPEASEIRDSAALLQVLEWARIVREAQYENFKLNYGYIPGEKHEVVLPSWLSRLVADDTARYCCTMLRLRGIEIPPELNVP